MIRIFALAVTVALLAGCGSSTTRVQYPDAGSFDFTEEDVAGPGGDDTEDPGPDAGPVEPALGLLEFFDSHGDDQTPCQGFQNPPDNTIKIDHCHFDMAYNQTRNFQVRYFEKQEDGTMVPKPSQEIAWELLNADHESGDPIATVDAYNTGTNPSGVAQVKVQSYERPGQFALKARAVGTKFQIPPLYFDIVVEPKQVEPLTVKVQYNGGNNAINKWKAYLFSQAVSNPKLCPALDPEHLPAADKASSELTLTSAAKFLSFPDITPDHPVTYTICAVAFKSGSAAVEAWGCNDEDGIVEVGKSTVVTIELRDLPPKYKGKYNVVNHFNMISALPDDIEMVVNIIIDFFNNPVAALLELTCILGEDALEEVCELFFIHPEDPDIDELTPIGSMASDLINALLLSLLEGTIGEDILFTGKDVGNILKDLEILSVIEFKSEPDELGTWDEGETGEEWHTVQFQWTLGQDCQWEDPNCGLKSFSFNTIGQDVVVSTFEAAVPGYTQGQFYDLVIYPHSLDFKYGAFLNFMIQKVVLPMVAGDGSDGLPVVDSYEKFIMSLLGGKECLIQYDCCDVFAGGLADPGSWMYPVIAAGCDALIPMGAAYLESFLMGLDASTGDTFTLATKDGVPCKLYDDNQDHTIDSMGKQQADMRCMWDVKLKLGSTDVFFDADFYGTK
ncbi:MAG: hypothetical protein FJ098_12345 [Deltaproteobacteria bacterium]|nr:hypothetical protein [Deltaproteobacteria bacterium]